MIRRWGMVGLIVVLLGAMGAGAWAIRRARSQTPLTITGPNILPNNDFRSNQDGDDLPDGWTSGTIDVRLSGALGQFRDGQPSVQLQGINNFLQSPFVAAQPGATYRVALRALSDQQPTEARILFHYRDAEGIEIRTTPGVWQPVPAQQWSIVQASDTAPPNAAQVAISIRAASDDVIFVTDVSMGQLGVRVNPWPDGKAAALAFSFDYETMMGGLIHGKSVADDPNAAADPRDRALRMRQGAENALDLFAPHDIRGTFYTNGYNFLTGNPECRTFMDDPIYSDWATTANGWLTDRWTTTPWFDDDPCATEAQAPEWYFGSQVDQLQAAEQDIQSHTFSHFAGTYVAPDDWRKDIAAWNAVAQERRVAAATSIAFPWSSSAGMRWENWRVLEHAGIRSITRTTWNQGQGRSIVADRGHWALRKLPGHSTSVIADAYLTPGSRDQVLQHMHTALLNEGAIDVWAHTEEVTQPDQIAAWRAAIDAAVDRFWVAPVPEIVQWAQDVRQVSIDVQVEQPIYEFTVRNGSSNDLHGITLTLPFAPDQITIDGSNAAINGTTLVLDLPRGATRTITLTKHDATRTTRHAPRAMQPEAVWRA